jgi:hypothetical protein
VVALTKGTSRTWGAALTYVREPDGRLTLQGEMDGRQIEAQLRRVEFEAFPLLNSTFRWMRTHEP